MIAKEPGIGTNGTLKRPSSVAGPVLALSIKEETMKKTVMAEKGPAPAGPYSHAVVAGGFVEHDARQGRMERRPCPASEALRESSRTR